MMHGPRRQGERALDRGHDGGERASPPSAEHRETGARPAVRAALIYAAIGAGWVLLSDRLVDLLVRDPGLRSWIQTAKGWAFVAVTAALVFVLVRGAMRERARSDAAILRAQAQILEELERRVEERTAELRERNVDLDAFSHSVSHDLRAPLRSVRGFAQALLEDRGDALGETGRDLAERIVHAAASMDRLITDLLAHSRLGREEISLSRVPLEEVVREVLDLLGAEIEATGAQVEAVPPLPPVTGNARILTQVLMNLVGNALRFVAPGVVPRVRISAAVLDGWVRIAVADNGIGVPEEYRDRIFLPLERLHGMERYPGTGMGLAIVRRGVERMGGRCGVESELGRGSTFWVELPAAQVEPGSAEGT